MYCPRTLVSRERVERAQRHFAFPLHCQPDSTSAGTHASGVRTKLLLLGSQSRTDVTGVDDEFVYRPLKSGMSNDRPICMTVRDQESRGS